MPILAVAPHWGAWIEILGFNGTDADNASHPTGVRGLKSAELGYGIRTSRVAPHWGAWIEITRHPTTTMSWCMSHPTGVRGLKSPCPSSISSPTSVAPHWGAWIEIALAYRVIAERMVAPHWGAWIEIAMPPRERVARNRRTPLGCVD